MKFVVWALPCFAAYFDDSYQKVVNQLQSILDDAKLSNQSFEKKLPKDLMETMKKAIRCIEGSIDTHYNLDFFTLLVNLLGLLPGQYNLTDQTSESVSVYISDTIIRGLYFRDVNEFLTKVFETDTPANTLHLIRIYAGNHMNRYLEVLMNFVDKDLNRFDILIEFLQLTSNFKRLPSSVSFLLNREILAHGGIFTYLNEHINKLYAIYNCFGLEEYKDFLPLMDRTLKENVSEEALDYYRAALLHAGDYDRTVYVEAIDRHVAALKQHLSDSGTQNAQEVWKRVTFWTNAKET